MHLLPVLNLVGTLLALLGVAQLVPVGYALAYGEAEWAPLLTTALGTAVVGALLVLAARNTKDISERDGFLVVTAGWVAAGLAGAVPYLATGAVDTLTDAVFESVSGFTTTGASVFGSFERMGHGMLLWRSMTQWFGGMGIIVLALVILPALGIGGMQLYKREVPGPYSEKITPRLRDTARALWSVYLLFTVLVAVTYWALGMTPFEAINHALTTVATGGFSTREDSFIGFNNPALEWAAVLFMFMGGMNFFLHYRLLFRPQRRWGFLKDTEWRVYLGVLTLATVAIAAHLTLQEGYAWFDAITKSAFQVVSINTTTGYVSDDYEHWYPSWQVLLLMMMFTGGCAGSTSGGIKWVRVILTFKFIRLEMLRLIHPRLVMNVKIDNTRVSQDILSNILAFMLLYMATVLGLTLLVALDGHTLTTSFSAVASAVSNIGPGLEDVGPTNNYGHFSPYSKWLMILGMLMGRLELMTVLVFLTPAFWKS